MPDEDKFAINEVSYDRIVQSFEIVRKRLGLNIKAHHDDGIMQRGQIFLFNHFARFETVIPPFLIHQATGAYCRSIADAALFETSEGLDKFLRNVGAMPNNLPGLLAFLAAEILRGRKVVVFPEGGMVKDRKVLDSDGEYGAFSRSSMTRRKHHLGAAVLALTLDIFKRRIRNLFERNDTQRIDRWTKSLGLDNPEILREKAYEPTLIIPANITFYPLRIEENILSRGAELLAKGLPEKFIEELVIEGNLLLRDTDMDIRFSDPVSPQKKWAWWESILLENYFKNTVTSLDDLFGLREERAISWSERMLARCISKETLRIREESMVSMYSAITVNLSHLASYTITRLIARNIMEIKTGDFHKILYLALKNLQATPEIHLHRSLFWPDRYRGLLDGVSVELSRFLNTCKIAGLTERSAQSYKFTEKLRQLHEFDDIRLENPLLVYANEVSPIEEVQETVEAALEKYDSVNDMEVASFLFDDELRAHSWNRKHFTTHRYLEINAQETATQSGAPFLFLPEEHVRKGVLLAHGFLASPAELAEYGKILSAEGYAVLGIRLAGHGTSPWDLKGRSWTEWLNSVRRGYRILSAFVDQIVIIGFSAGGVLSLMLAAEQPKKLIGVASVSAPQEYRNRKLMFVPLVHSLNKLAEWLPTFEGIMPFRENDPEHPDINYRNIPVHGLFELRQMTADLPDHMPEVDIPALIIQGDEDPVVEPDSALQIFNKLASQDKALHWIASERHGILNENIGDTWNLLTDFVARVSTPSQAWTRHNPPPHPTPRPVHLVFDESAARWPERPCLDFMGQVSSYGEIARKINQAAKGFQNLGIEKGDRIGLCLPNCPYFVISYFAAMKIGATVVNFNPLYTDREIRDQIIDSGTSVMVTLDLKSIYPKVEAALDTPSLRNIVVCSLSDALPPVKEILFKALKRSQIAEKSGDIRVLPFENLISQEGHPEPVRINPLMDIALLQYTGGTTGLPKGAMLTHANLTANIEQVKLWLGDVDPKGERFLCVIPFFHVFAMTAAMNLGIATGSELVLLPRFELKDVLKTIDAKHPTLFPAVPTIFGAINNYDGLERFDLSSVRFCISGGASLPENVKYEFEKLTGCVVVEGYGMTEASPVISCNPPDAENKVASIGLALPWTSVEIRDLEKPHKAMAIGERGQLAVKGPQVMTGYWNRPEETADTLQDGWLFSGDVGHVDEDGYLFLTDRLKDIILCSGFNVYPRVIEEALYQHPDVEEVTVIGIPDEYRGESPKAFIKLKAGANVTEAEILSFAEQHLNPIERPSEIEFRDELPKTMIGKLSKKELVHEHSSKQEEKDHG